MRNYIFIILGLTLLFAQCSPKTGKTMAENTSKEADVMDIETQQTDFRASAPAAAPAPEIDLGEYQTKTLENGLKVIVVENHKLPRVSFQLFVDRDQIKEGEKAGYVSIAGGLLATGTESKSKAEIDEAVDFIGANLSTSSRGAFASALSQHKQTIMELMADVILNPSFPEEEFEKAKKQTLSGLTASKNNPNAIASNIRSLVNFGADHPYGEFTTETSVENISLEDCRTYYQTYFKPNISYLVVVGDIEANEAYDLAEQYFGSWEKSEVPKHDYPMPERPDSRNVVFVDRPTAVQSVMSVTYPVELSKKSEDYVAAKVMNNILGGGVFSGYLMQNLREDKGYTYGARSSLSDNELVGSFNAFASVRNEVTDSATVEFLREMNRIREEKVKEEQLELVKSSMSGSFARSLENPQAIAQQALTIARFNLSKDFYSNYLKEIEAVSADDVMAAAQKYIQPKECNILIVGNKDEVADKLKRFDGDKEITFLDAEGNVVDMAAQALPEGLTAEAVIGKYIEALGGQAAVEGVKSLRWDITMDMMGMQLDGQRYIMFPNKYADIMQMNGMVVNKMVFNEGEGMTMNPQQGEQEMGEEDLADAEMSAHIFKEAFYEKMGYELELSGVENIEGEDAYKLKVTSPFGKSTTEYYSTESGLKLREVTNAEGPNGPIAVTTDYQDYTEIDGLMFPQKMEVSGPFPQPMKMATKEIQVNAEIDKDVFEIK